MKHVLLALVTSLSLSVNSFAATHEYRAITDFDELGNGTVPYYKDNPRDALAINAANESHRDVFARATTTFEGTTGEYDVTISALGELDGECEYRFLVNGVLIGSARNDRVSDDYEIQQHTFSGVSIPANAQISVASNAVTNGLVPEGDITAYARGRWRTLTIETAAVAPPDPVDISIAASASTSTPQTDSTYKLRLDVKNNSTDQTATSPRVTMVVPANTIIAPHALCTVENGAAGCPLAEISAGSTTTIMLEATTSVAGSIAFNPVVSADQNDDNTNNNSSALNITVSDPVTPEPREPVTTVDLNLKISGNTESLTNGQSVEYTLTVRNLHSENTATAPVAGAALPEGLQFSASADCTATARAVSCALPELAPAQAATVVFSAVATAPGNAEIIASVSANEPETATDDNEVRFNVVIADVESGAQNKAATTNGGSTDRWLLLMLFLMLCSRLTINRWSTATSQVAK